MNLKSPYISLADGVRYRKEHFGGIIFNTGTGTIVDVDREIYLLISLIKSIGIIDVNDLDLIWFNLYGRRVKRSEAMRVIEELITLEILVLMPQGILNKNYYDVLNGTEYNQAKWPSTQILSAPETVHWAVTFKCDSNCPDCYIRRHSYELAAELETKQALEIIDRISNAGVFQLAIGGGEPFLRDDIDSIVTRAYEKDLVVHITTGRYQHEPGVLNKISRYIKSMQLGIKHEDLMKQPEKEKEKLSKLMYMFSENGIGVGANLILSHSTISQFDRIIELLSMIGFKRITLLRFKPPGGIGRWIKEKPDEDALLAFERKFSKTVDTYPQIQFRLDCGLAFLERKLPSQKAAYYGIRGCSAADRILSIAPDGSLFPCSQLVGNRFYAGNLLVDDLKSIWSNSKVLKRYRKFRNKKAFKNSQCGQCTANIHCGGCRVFAEDALGADPGCPDPVLSPTMLRKYRDHDDLYNTIIDIQEDIGCTEGGAPFATFEEIKGWLDEENDHGYPQWLIKKL